MNDTARTKLDILYQEVLGDVAAIIQKVEKLKIELPAAIGKAADGAVNRFESIGTQKMRSPLLMVFGRSQKQ